MQEIMRGLSRKFSIAYIRTIIWEITQQARYTEGMMIIWSILFIAFGCTGLIMGTFLWCCGSSNTLFLMGVCLTFLGMTLVSNSSQQSVITLPAIHFPLIRHEYDQYDQLQGTHQGTRFRRNLNPLGFSKVKKTEYKKIPKDAIEPYIEEPIHNLIAREKQIIKCDDCGAYYDTYVWEYYGKKCVRIGCSNSDI